MIVAINKPFGVTSHDVIYQVRRITKIKKVGHAGTLDPAATGVLVVAIGRESTKKLTQLIQHDKEYRAEITLGAISSTDDQEGEITPAKNESDGLDAKKITQIVGSYVGTLMQVPPQYSAIKMKGKKAYELARKGIQVTMDPREVVIHSIKVVDFSWPKLTIDVDCGKGVYIRSLARDIGKDLGVGGYLSALTRTRVGDYRLSESMTLAEFENFWKTHAATDIQT